MGISIKNNLFKKFEIEDLFHSSRLMCPNRWWLLHAAILYTVIVNFNHNLSNRKKTDLHHLCIEDQPFLGAWSNFRYHHSSSFQVPYVWRFVRRWGCYSSRWWFIGKMIILLYSHNIMLRLHIRFGIKNKYTLKSAIIYR